MVSTRLCARREGELGFVHDRGQDFSAGIWVVDPAFTLDLIHQHLKDGDTAPAREEAYFAGARIDDDELRDAAAEDDSAGHRRDPDTPTRHAPTSGSGTTSTPG